MRPFPHRGRLILALLVSYVFATSLVGWHRLHHTKSLTQAFRGCHIFSLVTCGEEGNTTLPRVPACGTHALMCLQIIRENEKSAHFCSKFRAKNGFYFSVLFDFCCLFTRVWTGYIVLSFLPFALDSCFCHLRSVRVSYSFSLRSTGFTVNVFDAFSLPKASFVFPRFRTVSFVMCFAAYTCMTFSSCRLSVFLFFTPILFLHTYFIMPVPCFMAIFGYNWFACSMPRNDTILCFFFRLGLGDPLFGLQDLIQKVRDLIVSTFRWSFPYVTQL